MSRNSELFSQFERNVEIDWLVPQRVIYIQARGKVTVQQREWAHAEIIALIHSCSTPSVHLISHTKRMTHIDWSVFSRPSALHTHPRRGWWINVGIVPMTPMGWLSALIGKIVRRRYSYAETLQEALTTLQTLDPSLPDLTPFVHNSPLEALP